MSARASASSFSWRMVDNERRARMNQGAAASSRATTAIASASRAWLVSGRSGSAITSRVTEVPSPTSPSNIRTIRDQCAISGAIQRRQPPSPFIERFGIWSACHQINIRPAVPVSAGQSAQVGRPRPADWTNHSSPAPSRATADIAPRSAGTR